MPDVTTTARIADLLRAPTGVVLRALLCGHLAVVGGYPRYHHEAEHLDIGDAPKVTPA
jgi:hypothetical protein